jgi:hypothetical protein
MADISVIPERVETNLDSPCGTLPRGRTIAARRHVNARTATIEPNEQGSRPNANAIGVVRAAAE